METTRVFDAELVEAVADESGLDAERLRSLLETHQQSVRELTGVDTLLYDLRKYHDPDPLAERTEAAYYLVVPTDFWGEVAAHLSLSESEVTALERLHERRLRRTVDDVSDGQAVVLLRT
jgi:hypothetical protein